MYDTMRQELNVPHMENSVYDVVRRCWSCAHMKGTQYTHQKKLRLLPAAGPLDFVAMDIFGPLATTRRGKQFVLVIMERY